jgi:serine/threonine-protein kinase
LADISNADVRAEVSSLLAAECEPDGSIVDAVIGEAAQAVLDEPFTGHMVGHFQVIKPIGRGAMGEVYLAQDMELGRQVALKLLPRHFQQDNERLRRFEQEARAAAALNHPNIMAIYEVGQSNGQPFIAAEYVEGETLADRLRQGPLPVEEATALGVQIADALAAAHEKGIVHRDLKPANIKIKADGTVKVLDFGLAKLTKGVARGASPGDSPLVAQPATHSGVITGTAAYMAPEQARGKPVDKRADIWAFGVVLYEMLTGKCPFQRETMTDTLAAVVKEEPDLTRLPARLRAVVGRCLNKDLRKRWQDIGDVRIVLDEDIAEPVTRSTSRVPWIILTVACIAVLIASTALLRRSDNPVQQSLIRLSVDLGPGARLSNDRGMHVIAISPDGMRIAFACQAPNGELQICTRRFDQSQPVALPGTEGVRRIFFSPDGKWVGFGAQGKLKKISVEGGAPFTLCDAPFDRGAAWGEDGFIVASLSSPRGLVRIPENGGTPQPLTEFKPGEQRHRWPQVLPGAKAVLFTANTQAGQYDNASLEVISVKTGERKTLHRGGYYGRYLPSGHLIYMRQGTLFAARMDLDRLVLTGPPVPVLPDVTSRPGDGGADFDVSRSGIFVYQSGRSRGQTTVQWLEQSGKLQPLLPTPAAYDALRLSPDGKRLALVIEQAGNVDIWVYDLQRGTMSRVTFGGVNESPVWSHDGKHLAYARGSKPSGIWWVRADGSGDAQRLTEGVPTSFSADGKRLALEALNQQADFDIWTVPLEGAGMEHPTPGPPEPFLRTSASDGALAFSPDGQWLAYASDESGSRQIYVRPFSEGTLGAGGKWQISAEGGTSPIWSLNGRGLFYISSDRRIMVTSDTAKDGAFMAPKPVPWCDLQMMPAPNYPFVSSNIDLAPDGKRFAVLVSANTEAQNPPMHVNVLFNFFDELQRRVPGGK